MEPICISINETARVLGIGRTKVYELIKAGRLETVKIDRELIELSYVDGRGRQTIRLSGQ